MNRDQRTEQFEKTLWDAMPRRDASADRALSVLCSVVYDGDLDFLDTDGFELCSERLGFVTDRQMDILRAWVERCVVNE